MIRSPCYSGCVGLLALCAASAACGQFDDLDWNLRQDNACCTSIDVKTEEQAAELRRLGIARMGTGSLAMPFSEKTWSILEQAGFGPELTCLEFVGKEVLDDRIWRSYLGHKSKTKAARPVLARFRVEGSTGGEERNGLLFLDDALGVIATEANGGVRLVSDHAGLVAVESLTAEPLKWSSMTWEIFDRSGQKKGLIKTGIPDIEYPNGLVLSDAGNCAEVSQRGKLEVTFYDNDLRTARKVVASEDAVLDGTTHACFSGDGRYLAVQVVRHYGKNEVILCGSDGRRAWRTVPDELLNSPGTVWVADGGSYVVSSFVEWGYDSGSDYERGVTYVFDRLGGVVKKIPDFAAKDAIFSSSQKYVALLGGWGPQGVILLELPSGETVFHYRTSDYLRRFDFAGDGELIAVLTPSHLLLLDSQGRNIWDLVVPELAPNLNTQLSVSEDGREIVLVIGREVLTYKVVR